MRTKGIQMLAQMLVGSVQSLANWWADHQEVPRERIVEVTMDFAVDGSSVSPAGSVAGMNFAREVVDAANRVVALVALDR